MSGFRLLPVLTIAASLLAGQLRGEPGLAARELPIAGVVVSVNAQLGLITIRESNLLGFLRIKMNSYRVNQFASLNGLRSGDKVTAIFSGKDGALHRVRKMNSSRHAFSGNDVASTKVP